MNMLKLILLFAFIEVFEAKISPFNMLYLPDKTIFVHNHVRRNQFYYHKASDMSYMELDEGLMREAENWAQTCSFKAKQNYPQNVVWSDKTDDIDELFEQMKKNKKAFNQMIFSRANRVGCAIKNCNRINFLVCNYNKIWLKDVPLFRSGNICSHCSSYENICYAGLCARKNFYASHVVIATNLVRRYHNEGPVKWSDAVAAEAERSVKTCTPGKWPMVSTGPFESANPGEIVMSISKIAPTQFFLDKETTYVGCGLAECGDKKHKENRCSFKFN